MSNEKDLAKLKFNNISYKELYDLKNENILKDYFIIEREKVFLLKGKRKDKKIYFFFFKPISVIFLNINMNNELKNYEINNIYSSIQIEDYFNNFNISKAEIIFKNTKHIYSNIIFNIDNFIENDKLIVYNISSTFEKYSFNADIFKDSVNKMQPENLSKYFYDYFLYHNKNDIFEYYHTQNRKKLYSYLETLLFSDELHFFIFCGPTSTGKSTTLLRFSRKYNNIIYLNLKVIYHLEQNNNNYDYYNLIIYEFGRLEFDNDKEKENFQKFLTMNCQNKPSMIIIYNILNEIKDQNCMIIFDQFKIKYINENFFNKIEELIKNSSLKLVLCSSITDKEIRDEVIKTINTFEGNIEILNSFSQNYFFYFSQNFFQSKLSGNIELDELLQLFNYNAKFKYLLINCKNIHNEIEKIKNEIKNKIKSFFKYEKDLDLCKILLNIKNKINVKFEYSKFSNIIENVPLNYYTLNLDKEHFNINYAFEFMKILEKENINQKDCFNYFKQQKYLFDKTFEGKEKKEFFEMCVKFHIEKGNILPMIIDETITVKNIFDMEFGKIIYNNKKSNIKYKEIELVKKLLKENDIDSKEKLDMKYSNKKNINYYLLEQALNFIEKNKNNKEKKNKNKNKKISKFFLKKKRSRGKKLEDYSIENNISNKNILIIQEDINNKTLDQIFIYGENNNKILLGLQMIYFSDKVDNSNSLNNVNKEKIKKEFQNILLHFKIDLNIQIKQWHYILIAYYNKKDVDNIYCKQLERHCKNNDLEIVYFDPEEKKLYNNEFIEIKHITISLKSNLDFDFPESNPYNMFYKEEMNDLINSYYNQRIKKLNMINYYEQGNIDNLFANWIKETNLKKEEIEKSLKELCQVNYLKLIDNYELDKNFNIPSPNKGYLFLLKNKKRNNFVCYYNKEGLKAINLEELNNITILEIPIYIDTTEKNFFVFSYLE